VYDIIPCQRAGDRGITAENMENSMKESIRMTEDRDKWRKYVHGAANPRIEDG